MGDLVNGITPAGGAIGVFVTILLVVLTAMLKKFDRGSSDVVAGYSGLAVELRKSAEAAENRAARAETALGLERSVRVRVQEYARSLEERLGIPHRVWGEVP